MSIAFYHVLHIVGLILLFVGLGGLANGYSKGIMKFHGIGLVLLLVAGFGMVAKLKLSYTSPFILSKVVIFLALGFLPSLVKRNKLSGGAAVILSVVLGAVAAYIAHPATRPF